MLAQIKQLAQEHYPQLLRIRRHIHANPELSYVEHNTAAFVTAELQAIGFTQIERMATTGVVATLQGKPHSRVVGPRADMDALPITEENDLPFKSTNTGVMHACGHDVHTTCLLGAAKILFELKDHWEGTIKFIFQPGEEKNPGGASLLIKEGVLENPTPQKIFGLHVHPMPVGKLSFRPGVVMASTDEIYISIKGKGGHAAAPHITTDIILLAAQIITNLQQIVSRNNNPFNPCVISICSVQGGNATNVIPSEVQLKGTLRCMNEDWRSKARDLITKYVKETATTYGATADVCFDIGYPVVKNDEALHQTTWPLATEFIGANNISETELRMGAEDFSFYTQKIPGCFFRLGAGNLSKGFNTQVHTPTFMVDEDCLPIGAGIMAWLGAKG
jgi:amidohydrolase